MARIDYIKYRLNNWALWRVRESSGGLGFAKQSVLLTVGASGHRESIVPVDNVDAQATELAVQSLKIGKPHLHQILFAYYLSSDAGSAPRVAKAIGCAASTVYSNLDAADLAISQWLRASAAAKK